MSALDEIVDFLGCSTPDAWLEAALAQQDVMLIDHAHCEKKAAMSALNMMHRYPENPQLLQKMSRLAREELRHFEQVLKIIDKRQLRFSHLTASRYATGLREQVRKQEPGRVVDLLIVGAFIEARSCERFARIAPLLDEELGKFYQSLLESEARHYQDYLKLARDYAQEDLAERIETFRLLENALIQSPDTQFRFHSGCPESAALKQA